MRVMKWAALLSVAVVILLVLPFFIKKQENIQPSSSVDEPSFELTHEFATQNDGSVLRAALASHCNLAGRMYVVLGEPVDKLDGRRSLGALSYPEDIDCDSIQFKNEADFNVEISGCPNSIANELHGNRITCIQKKYPGFSGWLSLDLPAYRYKDGELVAVVDFGVSCGPLCGSGWRATLRWIDGSWRLVATEPAWIS